MGLRIYVRPEIMLMTDRRLRHELRQCYLGFDPLVDDPYYWSPWELEIREEVRRRLDLRPVEECVCEECWPHLPQATG